MLAIIGEQHQPRSYVGNRVKVNSNQFQVLQSAEDEIEIEIIQKSGNIIQVTSKSSHAFSNADSTIKITGTFVTTVGSNSDNHPELYELGSSISTL